MVDEIKTPDAIASAPAASAPASNPAPEISTTPATDSTATPAVSPAEAAPSVVKPVAEAPKAETPTPSETDGVLGAEPKPVEKKIDESAKASESKTPEKATVKPEDSGKPAEKPVLPTYDEFKTPEGVKLDKEPLTAFTNILGEIETGKLDHKGMQEAGQKLIDLAAKNTLDSINRLNDYYVELHKTNVDNRLMALKADPKLGGKNFEKTVSALHASVLEYGGTEAQIAEFRKEITEAGLSPSPAICRLVYNMQQKINEYTTEGDSNRIVPGAKPAAVKVKPYEAFYSGNKSA